MNLIHVKDTNLVTDLYDLADADEIRKYFVGDKDAWVQWLMENVRAGNEKLVLLQVYENEEIRGYIVFWDGYNPPITNELIVLYVYSELSDNLAVWYDVLDFIRNSNLPKAVRAATKTPRVLEQYGFVVDDAFTTMVLRIEGDDDGEGNQNTSENR